MSSTIAIGHEFGRFDDSGSGALDIISAQEVDARIGRQTLTYTDLGSLGATETLSFANGPRQAGTLDAATVITLPSLPAAGDAQQVMLKLTQDATGGYVPQFSTTAAVEWVGNVVPSLDTLHTAPGQSSFILFDFTEDGVTAEILNPRTDSASNYGGSYLQLDKFSFLGDSTVSKRVPAQIEYTEASTTDATATTILSIPVPLNSVRMVEVQCMSLQDDGTEGSAHKIIAYFRRGASGNVAEIAAETVTLNEDDSSGTMTVTAAVNTTNQEGLIQVNGVAATNLTWTCFAIITGQTL